MKVMKRFLAILMVLCTLLSFNLTALAEGEEGQQTQQQFTVTYLDKNGEEISTEQVNEGETVTAVPELPENSIDESGHTLYSWNGDITAAITGNISFQVLETTGEHCEFTYSENAENETTHIKTCGICGFETMEAHTEGDEVVENDNKVSYDSVVYCSLCEKELKRDTYYEVKFFDKDGALDVTEYVLSGKKAKRVPKLPAANGHTTYSWDGDTTAAINAATTFQVIETIGDHTYGEWTSDGADTHSRSCTLGDDTQTEAHAWVAGATTPSSCTVQGSQAYTCSVCGETKSESLPLAAHTPADPVEEGDESVVYCSVCGYEISRTAIADSTFTFVSYTIDTDAETATVTFTGDTTGNTYTDTAALDVDTAAADCTTAGQRTYTASYDGQYGTAPAATEANGGLVIVPLAALGHDYVAGTVIAPTCTDGGYTVYKCTRCDATENREFTDATGHTFSGAVCTVCGAFRAPVESSAIADNNIYFVNDAWSSNVTINRKFDDGTSETVVVTPAMGTVKNFSTAQNSNRIENVKIEYQGFEYSISTVFKCLKRAEIYFNVFQDKSYDNRIWEDESNIIVFSGNKLELEYHINLKYHTLTYSDGAKEFIDVSEEPYTDSLSKLVITAKKGSFYLSDDVVITATGYDQNGVLHTTNVHLASKCGKPSLKVKAGKKKATLTWKKVNGATGYRIYRSTKKKSGYKLIKTIKKAKTVKYIDKGAKKSKKKYYYYIVAYNSSSGKLDSAKSKIVAVKVK